MLRITLVASLFAIAAVDCTCSKPPGDGKHDAGPGGKEGEGEGTSSEGEGTSGEGEGANAGEGEGEGGTCAGATTCATFNANCGPVSNGCGGLVECGTCPSTQFCGGAGPSQCGGSTTGTGACVPVTCADVGANCGPISNGCGDSVDCGTCTGTDSCGFAGANKCGSADISTCVKDTCATNNTQCGPVADGCGGLTASCGSCSGTDICGATAPGQCGGNGATCTNLCLQQVSCGGGATTTISGTVLAPNGLEPIYDALVYIPNGTVDAIPDGITGQCLTCNAQASGDPLVQTVTGPDGKFTLTNAPAGNNIPIVIQLGFWRRQITVNVTQCTTNSLDGVLGTDNKPITALPHRSGTSGNAGQGDIPLTAMVSGQVDTLECVLRQIGVDDDQFGDPGSGKRIQIFQENGAKFDTATPAASAALYDSQQHINAYDQVLFACEGAPNEKSPASQGIVQAYANAGGRVFATHYQYTWLYENDPWGCNAAPTQACTQNSQCTNVSAKSICSNGKCTNPTCSTAGHTIALWDPDQANNNLGNQGQSVLVSSVNTGFQKGADLSSWLDVVGASTAPGSSQIDVNVWRRDLDGVVAPGQAWLTSNAPSGLPSGGMVEHLTFNTPAENAADAQCGRVLYSDFHVSTASGTQNEDFPLECGQCSSNAQCGGGSCFGTCASGSLPNACTSNTQCQQASGNGNDQCVNKFCNNVQAPQSLTPQQKVLEFMLFDLAACIQPDTGPPPPVCTKQQCVPGECGPIADGCGGSIDCGNCPAGQQCGLGGPSKCGGACTPETCADQGIQCGPAGDGCGNLISGGCGDCPPGQTCGGGGVHGVCGQGPCSPTSCSAANAQCGAIADGCGGSIDCGVCPNGADQCGLQAANQCCNEGTCSSLNAQCGSISDGCNHTLDCGQCPNNAPCTNNKCCVPTTCAAKGADCGSIDDGCGGSLDCGQCPTNEVCGLTTPNKCGTIGG
jgi:hypothetical protein